MIVLRTPKGWTGPKTVDGLRQKVLALTPGAVHAGKARTSALLEEWMRSYRPEELFDDEQAAAPRDRRRWRRGNRRMSANPHANGGQLMRRCVCPISQLRRRRCSSPGARRPNRRACWATICAT